MGLTSTQGFKFKLVADGVILDLFHDEEIKVSDNITGLFDLGVLPADFTQTITLPGSKKNNHFFEFVYDISVENPFTFSTNQKVPCYLDFDGIYLSAGYMQLNKVNVLANKFVESYEITVYGGLASFGRDLKRYFLTDMTASLAQFNHTASLENISASWSGNLFSGSIVYPMAEYGEKITYGNAFGINTAEGGMCVEDYKPAIRLKEVWDAMFTQFGYTYTSAFWQQSWLNNVYLILNNKLRYPIFENIDLETYGQFKIAPVSGSGTNAYMDPNTPKLLPWFNILQNPSGAIQPDLVWGLDFDSKVRGQLNLNFQLSSSVFTTGVPQFNLLVKSYPGGTTVSDLPLTEINNYMLQVQKYNGSGGTAVQTFDLLTNFSTALMPSGSYQYWLKYAPSGGSNLNVTLDQGNSAKSYLSVTKVNQGADGRVINIGKNMPYGTAGIKMIDFMTSIQKKFNLVIQPNKTKLNDFIVEPFNTWYKSGTVKDFNRYINLNSSISVTPANNLAVQNLNFGDTLDQDYISLQFSKAANREFGKTYYIDTQNFFSQGTFEVKTTLASSPLIYLSGTGISGSNQTVVAYQLTGDYKLSTQDTPRNACLSSTGPYQLFSSTGNLEPSAVLYFDEYGTQKVIGYSYLIDRQNACDVWEITSLGVVVGGTPYGCPNCT